MSRPLRELSGELITGEHDIETSILDKSRLARDRIIGIQERHLKAARAGRLGKWLLSRKPFPDIDFGFEADDWGDGDMNVSTVPLVNTIEQTEEGEVTVGWIFKLQSPIPEVMSWRGERDIPIHAWGSYGRSPLRIFRHVTKKDGSVVISPWATIDPNNNDISCEELAGRRELPLVTLDPELHDELVNLYQLNGRFALPHELSPENQARSDATAQADIDRIMDLFKPDQETSEQLSGLLDKALVELIAFR